MTSASGTNGFQPLEPPAPHKGRAAAKAVAQPFFASLTPHLSTLNSKPLEILIHMFELFYQF